jgi:hypothetical protein
MELVIAIAPASGGGGTKSRKKCGCGDKNMDKKTIEFMAPEGMEMPEGLSPGDTFEAMATIQVGEEGKLNLAAIDGAALGGGVEEAEEAEEGEAEEMVAEGGMSEGGFLDAVERRAASGNMMA